MKAPNQQRDPSTQERDPSTVFPKVPLDVGVAREHLRGEQILKVIRKKNVCEIYYVKTAKVNPNNYNIGQARWSDEVVLYPKTSDRIHNPSIVYARSVVVVQSAELETFIEELIIVKMDKYVGGYKFGWVSKSTPTPPSEA